LKKFGYFGGSFDPVQKGHLILAAAARRQLKLDEVYFVPAARSPFKSLHAVPARHRAAMLGLALQGRRGFSLASWDLKSPGPSYTYKTLSRLRKKQGGDRWFLIIGSDSYQRFKRWRRWREILRHHTVAVGRRPGFKGTDLPRDAQGQVLFLKGSFPPVSSTEIRRRLKKGLSVGPLTPPAVSAYIRRRGLYR